MPGEYISGDGKVKVELEDMGEGVDGDYEEDDPQDEPLLRFSVYRRYDRGEQIAPYFTNYTEGGPAPETEWLAVSDASYCTNLNANLTQEAQDRAGRLILACVEADVREQNSVKRLCEELSWLDESDLAGNA